MLAYDAGLPALLGHELRNPLAGAMTNVAVAAELTDADDPRASLLRIAHRELARLHALLERCLEFARLGRVATGRHDLVALVREVAERPRQGRVRVRSASARVEVGVDRALFERALENLLENAFAAGATAVELVIEDGAEQALLDVSDDGPGVAANVRDRIFEPFVSGRGSHGLGLPFAKQVVDAHGGSIRLTRSERGATFRIALPS